MFNIVRQLRAAAYHLPLAASFQPTHQHPSALACWGVPAGESGSGKSVLVEALGQLLGATAFDEAVRPPATTALVEGTVAVAPAEQPLLRRLLGELGVPARAARNLNTLTLRRELSKGEPAAAGSASLARAHTLLAAPPACLACLLADLHAAVPAVCAGADGSVRSRCFINISPTSGELSRGLAVRAAPAAWHAFLHTAWSLTEMFLCLCPFSTALSAVRALREVGLLLVDVNGQNAQLSLKDGTTRVRLVPLPARLPAARPCFVCFYAEQLLGESRGPHALDWLLLASAPVLQLRLLDRLAGTSAAADSLAACLADWQKAAAQVGSCAVCPCMPERLLRMSQLFIQVWPVDR